MMLTETSLIVPTPPHPTQVFNYRAGKRNTLLHPLFLSEVQILHTYKQLLSGTNKRREYSSSSPLRMETTAAAGAGGLNNNQEPASFDELYNVDLVPSELFLKFRKQLQGVRIGLNLEFYNAPSNDFQAKFVLKPSSPDRKWKFMYEATHHDVRLLSKKIPLTKFLNLQVGVGHSFQLHATGWKWKLTTCLGGDGVSRIRNKTSVGLFPGMDLRFGWRAEYVLPEITGAVGTGDPIFNLNSGRLQASLDRVEAILTHTT